VGKEKLKLSKLIWLIKNLKVIPEKFSTNAQFVTFTRTVCPLNDLTAALNLRFEVATLGFSHVDDFRVGHHQGRQEETTRKDFREWKDRMNCALI